MQPDQQYQEVRKKRNFGESRTASAGDDVQFAECCGKGRATLGDTAGYRHIDGTMKSPT